MSNLFGMSPGRTAATTSTRAMGIDLQGSQYGPPIPVVYGRNKVSGNVIDYWGFKSLAHTQSVGKGGSQSSTSYTYQASYLNGLCEGPIVGIVNVWSGTSLVLLSTLAPFSATGTLGQAAWSALPSGHSLGYSGTALFGVSDMALGGSPTLPNYNYEVSTTFEFGSGIVDANPSAILTDLCTNAQYGLPFDYLGTLTQYSDYCVANGLFLSPVYDQQSTGVQVLTDLFKATNTYAYFSEGVLKVVPLGDVAVTGNGVTYTPDVTPVVNLGAGDFIVSGQASTVTVQRKAPQDCLNLFRVEYNDRSNTYHNSAVIASIDEDMITNGARSDQSLSINGCTSGSVARFVAQNMVQRAYYVRNTYQFKLSWRYCYLEPTDLVTLTDANTGLNLFPVRITSVEEDGEGLLSITAEEFPEGIGHSALYASQSGGQSPVDPNTDPGAVNAPYLFRAPGYLVGGANPEVWCAVCGSGALWAGCDVYLSHDGTSYGYLGTIDKPARYGVTTSSFPPAPADPDTATTLGVSLYAPAVLNGGTQADADNLNTLAMVGAELLAYETATLTGSEAYNLTYLRRNAYGTTNGSGVTMAGGAPFVRIDPAIFRIPVDPSSIGQTVYLKFLSLNAFGKTPRTLAEETAYTYVIGSSVELPDVPPVPSSFAATAVADGVNLTWSNSIPAAVSEVVIYRSTLPTSGFTELASVGPTTTFYTDHFTSGATYYYYLIARGPLISSGYSAATATISSTGKTVANGATNGFTTGPNLIPNPSAGAGNSGWYPVSNILTPEVDQNGPYWQGFASGDQGNNMLTPLPVTPGTTLTLGGSMRSAGITGGGAPIIALQFLDSSFGALSAPNVPAALNTSWADYSMTVTAPAGAAWMRVYTRCYLPTGGGVPGWRNLKLEVGSAATPYNDLGTQLGNKLTQAGSGQQIGDNLNLYPIITAGAQAVWQNLSITYTAAAGSPATATISVSAAQILGLQNAGATVGYNASSANVTGTGGTVPTYFLYYIDPAYSGGTQTLYATTTGNDLRQRLGIVYIGSVAVTFPTSGSGGGSGGGGLCVTERMFIRRGRRAVDAIAGEIFDCADFPTRGLERFERALLSMDRGESECVHLIADDGCELECSVTTPFDLLDGGEALAPDMLGERVLTDCGIARIVEVLPIGAHKVCRMHFGGISYAAGLHADRRIYSHNSSPSKP